MSVNIDGFKELASLRIPHHVLAGLRFFMKGSEDLLMFVAHFRDTLELIFLKVLLNDFRIFNQ